MQKQWKGRSSDGWIVLLFYVLFVIGFHTVVAVFPKHRHFHLHETIYDRLFSVSNLLLAFVIVTLVCSPIWTYFRKVPRSITIDSDLKKLTIERKRKRKSVSIDFTTASYFFQKSLLYSVLEIYSDSTTSRGHIIRHRFASIIIPSLGLSWNTRVLEDIVKYLKSAGVPINQQAKSKRFFEHISD